MIIAAGEGTDVAAAAAGTITEISTDAQTGQTVRMDIGDGYTLIYGQLQDLKYNEGAHLDAGDVMGTVAAATKYYSVEGNNLYFAMEKDGSPVDPTEYLPQ
jgi:septal ring factor EnvC (AmiA/AmiB activator)